ncbi:MAG: primosomal protein N' [Anaerolineales bacterium]
MTQYVDIAVNVPHVHGTYHYHLPPGLRGRVEKGQLVIVPFGSQRVQGIVLGFVDQPEVPRTKPIQEILDRQPVVTPHQIQLAKHISEETLSPLGITLHAMLPSGLSVKADTLYRFTQTSQDRLERNEPVYEELTEAQRRFVDLLIERGPLRGRQIDRALPHKRWRQTAGALERRDVIESTSVLESPSVRPKKERFVTLTSSAEEISQHMDSLAQEGYPDALHRRQAILRLLMDRDGPVNVSDIYAETGSNLSDLRQLEKRDLLTISKETVLRDPLEDLSPKKPQSLTLTQAQSDVWKEIEEALQEHASHVFLLYGVTGSGKTEIYLRAVDQVIEKGKQAIILVPEIALTPQTVGRFFRRFPDQVGVLHSELSPGERYDTWRLARRGDIAVVVGPRSALFTPFPDIGLIVVDECHDDSYYQAETPPFYHAATTAAAYAQLMDITCIMGSATPNVTSTYKAAQGEWTPLSLPERILAHKDTIEEQIAKSPSPTPVHRYQPLEKEIQMAELPPVEIVDMREELKAGNRSIFSRLLTEQLQEVLERDQQAILFLNRRGTSTYVFCRDCGYALKCPRCDISLTYHQHDHSLICHHCGYQRGLPQTCPSCGSTQIRQVGTGTEEVEVKLLEAFPSVRTLRWDRDTTRKKGAHWRIMETFTNHEADVLIGTQMLAKGLDLPLVTLVGVVLADTGLNLPDYRTDERTFQILTQVAGRAGRSPLGGQVILQTYQPDHFVIQTASQHDYRRFYRQEISNRRKLRYPPLTKLVRIETSSPDAIQTRENAQELGAKIKTWIREGNYEATQIIGPAPCFFARVRGQYRWQIILRGPDPTKIIRGRLKGPDWKIEVNPPSFL